jgi:3-deoxy-manno-octulosonate cytidylyltransferase (CMP-KDO synthetase)
MPDDPSMRAVVVIPARLQSTRLPRKLLLDESGKPLIQHVHERAAAASRAARVVIATDSEEIRAVAEGFGAEALLTRDDHLSGTDRVAEAVRLLEAEGERPDLVVNVQGDEPELDPALIDRLIEVMEAGDAPMGTLAEPLQDPEDLARPQVVKVVVDANGRALYFSRAAIPHGAEPGGDPAPLRHLGIYAYRPAFLQAYCTRDPAPLERVEKLEQLRALHHGHSLQVAVVEGGGARGIDTRADYDAFLARLNR